MSIMGRVLRQVARSVVACVALFGVLLATVPTASAQGELDRILREKKVKVGWIASPPHMMKNPTSGKLEGYFIDAIRYIFKEVDVEPEFVELNFSTFISALQTKQIDLCIASTLVTIKRAAVVDFTRPILYFGYSAVVRKDETRFSSLADFNKEGIKIAVLLGGAAQQYVRTNFPKAQIVTLNTNDQTAPFVEAAAGRVDVGINDAWSARRFATAQPSVKDLFGDKPYNVQPTAWTVRKGNSEMRDFLNAAIETMMISGKFEELAREYDPSGRYKEVITLAPFAAK
ncbi:MAG: amino acid ABC transporter substrate-binding protein [Rhodospirillales bacterium]|nr:amino acid ABC transporter substrate-binding protein [Rhodospirillales bacterium]